MRRTMLTQNGFTLVEILVAVALLGIISAAFAGLFGNMFVNVFSSGHRTDATVRIAERFESLYELRDQMSRDSDGDPALGQIITAIEEHLSDGFKIEPANENDLLDYQGEGFNFMIVPKGNLSEIRVNFGDDFVTIQGLLITIVEFYLGGNRHVSLATFIGRRGEP